MNTDNILPHEGINRGVELMLRRRANQKHSGLKIHKTLALFTKVFQFKLELTWRESTKT